MRITKQIASEVAHKLVAKKTEENKENWNKLQELVYDSVKTKINPVLLKLMEEYPNLIKSTSSVRLIGNGFNHEQIPISNSLPCENWVYNYVPTEKEGNKWIKIYNDYRAKKEEIKNLERDIENTLYSLKTYNAVKDNFPEAYEFLPEKITTSLSVNLSDIRQRIK